jgi:hypothetical protein
MTDKIISLSAAKASLQTLIETAEKDNDTHMRLVVGVLVDGVIELLEALPAVEIPDGVELINRSALKADIEKCCREGCTIDHIGPCCGVCGLIGKAPTVDLRKLAQEGER